MSIFQVQVSLRLEVRGLEQYHRTVLKNLLPPELSVWVSVA